MLTKIKYISLIATVSLAWGLNLPVTHAAFHLLGANILTADGTVYTITTENGQTVRRPYTSAGAYLSYGFNSWGNLVSASSDDYLLPVGSYIPPQDGKVICSDRGNDKGTCYLISQGAKIGFPSEQIFKAQGFNFADALSGDTSFLPYSTNIASENEAHKPGVLVNLNGTVYLVGPNGLLGFPNATIFSGWGYKFGNVITANAADATLTKAGVIQTKASGQLSAFNPVAGFSLNASLSSLGSPIYVSAAVVNQRIASFDLSVSNSGSQVTLNSVGIQTASNNVAGNFQNLKVYVNGQLFGTAISNPANNTPYTFYSQSGTVALTPNQLASVEVYADSVGNAVLNQPVVTLDATRTYVQTGDYTLTGSNITYLPTSVTGQTVIVQSANSTGVNASGKIQISSITMPNGVVGQPYSGTISWTASNISPTTDVSMSVYDSTSLPFIPGLTLSPNGLSGAPGAPIVISGLKNTFSQGQLSIGGTPTQPGTYTFSVSVKEYQNNTSDSRTVTITIQPANTGSLNLSLSGGNILSVSANNQNQIIGAFVLANNSTTDTLNLSSITVQMANSNITGNFQNLNVYVAGSQLYTTQPYVYNSDTNTFFVTSPMGGVQLKVAPQTSMLITVNADLPYTIHAFNSQSLLTITGVNGTWQNSGQTASLAPNLAGQTVTVQGASY